MSSKHVHTLVMLIDLKNHSSFGDHFCLLWKPPRFQCLMNKRILPWTDWPICGKYMALAYMALVPARNKRNRYPLTHAHGRGPGSISADKNGITLCVCASAITLSLAKNHPCHACLVTCFSFCLQKRTKQADPGIMALYHLMARSSNQL
jgi:hypothetical protein